MAEPVNHIATEEELMNVLILGLDLVAVEPDSFINHMAKPRIGMINGIKVLTSNNGSISFRRLVFDKTDVGVFLFTEYEDAFKWSMKVFKLRASGDIKWAVHIQ